MKTISEKYNFYVNKETDKLLRIHDTNDEEFYSFTENDFIQICNLFGYDKEDFEVVEWF